MTRILHYRVNTVISDSHDIAEEKDHNYADMQTRLSPKLIKPRSNLSHFNLTRKITLPSKFAKLLFHVLRESLKDLRTRLSPLAFQHLLSKPTLSGANLFMLRTNPRKKQCNLVYGLTCVAPDCGESYVGETKQSLKARLTAAPAPKTQLFTIIVKPPTTLLNLKRWSSLILKIGGLRGASVKPSWNESNNQP